MDVSRFGDWCGIKVLVVEITPDWGWRIHGQWLAASFLLLSRRVNHSAQSGLKGASIGRLRQIVSVGYWQMVGATGGRTLIPILALVKTPINRWVMRYGTHRTDFMVELSRSFWTHGGGDSFIVDVGQPGRWSRRLEW
jgi:hypothetical protein